MIKSSFFKHKINFKKVSNFFLFINEKTSLAKSLLKDLKFDINAILEH